MINDTLFMNAIKEYMLCKPINEICNSFSINRQTFYRKKEKFKKDYRLDVDLIRKNNKTCIEYNIKYIDNIFLYNDCFEKIGLNKDYFIKYLQDTLTHRYNMNTHKIAMKMQDKRLCQILNITLKELKYRRENGLIGM